MRKQLIAAGTAIVLGIATTTTGTIAFARGGGFGGGGHIGGLGGGGHGNHHCQLERDLNRGRGADWNDYGQRGRDGWIEREQRRELHRYPASEHYKLVTNVGGRGRLSNYHGYKFWFATGHKYR